jgi:hypothetical protein
MRHVRWICLVAVTAGCPSDPPTLDAETTDAPVDAAPIEERDPTDRDATIDAPLDATAPEDITDDTAPDVPDADVPAADIPRLDAPPDAPPDAPTPDRPAPDVAPVDGGGCVLSGRVYYVSARGADANDGSAARPFATIARGLAAAQPGETVAVGAGTYRELVTFPRSGRAGAPITLRAACGERPIVDGVGLGRGVATPALVRIEDRSFVTVQGFELRGLTGVGGNFPAGVWVRGACSDVTVRDNVVHTIHAENGGRDHGAHGIAVYGTRTTPTENVVLEGNELRAMVLGPSEAMVLNGNVRRFTVRGNTVHDVNNIAFDFIGFERDVCPSCGGTDVVDSATVNRARDGLVAENLAYNVTSARNPAYAGEKAAGCFYVDGGARIVIERNRAHHCDLGVELASEHAGLSTREITVRNNALWLHDVTGISTGGYDPGTGPGGGSAIRCVVAHNTIVDASRSGWANTGLLLQNRNVDNVYVNNVIVSSTGSGRSSIASGGTMNRGNTVDYNLTFRGGVSGLTVGTRMVSGDPRFVSEATADFRLQAGSPALDRAQPFDAARDGTVDLAGSPRLRGAAPDLGAHDR